MSIGIGNLLNMFLHNGATNTVKAGVLHRSDPPQAILVESQADLEHLGEVPAGSIAYTAGYGSMWQLSAAGSWEEIQEEGGSGGFSPDITNPQDGDTLVYNATAGKWVNGSGGGGDTIVLTVTPTEARVLLNATYSEVKTAMMAGKRIVFSRSYDQLNELYALMTCEDATDPEHGDVYYADFVTADNHLSFIAETESDQLYLMND